MPKEQSQYKIKVEISEVFEEEDGIERVMMFGFEDDIHVSLGGKEKLKIYEYISEKLTEGLLKNPSYRREEPNRNVKPPGFYKVSEGYNPKGTGKINE